MTIVFYASSPHFLDHLYPIFQQFSSSEAEFYVPEPLIQHANNRAVYIAKPTPIVSSGRFFPPRHGEAIVVAAANDAMAANRMTRNTHRPIIFLEHGLGITFPFNQGYAGSGGIRQRVGLFLAPNEFIRDKTWTAIREAKQVVVGTPKMDKWAKAKNEKTSIVCISFHWDGSKVQPEAGNALEHYRGILPDLYQRLLENGVKLIGHGHPRIVNELRPIYAEAGIEFVDDFEKVLQWSSLYINDASSTVYEAAHIMPVIFMNSPKFRKDVDFGIRWWRWTDIGPHCWKPEALYSLIVDLLKVPDAYLPERTQMIKQLYPYVGKSSQRAAQAIRKFVYDGEVIE